MRTCGLSHRVAAHDMFDVSRVSFRTSLLLDSMVLSLKYKSSSTLFVDGLRRFPSTGLVVGGRALFGSPLTVGSLGSATPAQPSASGRYDVCVTAGYSGAWNDTLLHLYVVGTPKQHLLPWPSRRMRDCGYLVPVCVCLCVRARVGAWHRARCSKSATASPVAVAASTVFKSDLGTSIGATVTAPLSNRANDTVVRRHCPGVQQ